jgi:hypothetical protein
MIKEKLTCSSIIKKVLNNSEWLSYDKLKDKSNDIEFSGIKRGEINKDTFTKALNYLLKNKEILVKKEIYSKNTDQYIPRNDKIIYYFKLNSNPSTKLAPELNADELLKLLKNLDTKYLFKLNNINNVENHTKDNLIFEIESYDLYSSIEQTNFILDVYKYSSPKKAYDSYMQFNHFNNDTSYEEITTKFIDYLKSPADSYNILKSVININYNLRCYVVKIDNSIYINKKISDKKIKTIILVNNLVMILYYSCYYYNDIKDSIYSGKIINSIQKYIKFLEDKRET